MSYLLGDTATIVRVLILDTEKVGGAPLETVDIRNQRKIELRSVLQTGRSLRVELSPNIGALRLQSSTRTPAYWNSMTKSVRARNGFRLDELANDLAAQGKSGAVTVTVWFELYGGDEASTDVIFV